MRPIDRVRRQARVAQRRAAASAWADALITAGVPAVQPINDLLLRSAGFRDGPVPRISSVRVRQIAKLRRVPAALQRMLRAWWSSGSGR